MSLSAFRDSCSEDNEGQATGNAGDDVVMMMWGRQLGMRVMATVDRATETLLMQNGRALWNESKLDLYMIPLRASLRYKRTDLMQTSD
jgi:hypothetical protein